MPSPANILITGASSGIGRALAHRYARLGVTLALSGRDADRLEETAAQCRRAGADIIAGVIDATDTETMGTWIGSVDDRASLDLVIANAGISGGTGNGGETTDQAHRILRTNIDGVINTIHPAIDRMRRRGRGQIVIISSLAAYRGFPGAPAYCASKAAVRMYGQALRGALHYDGIGVTVVCPGFVESGMTAVNKYRMPMLMPADQAAALIAKGIARNRANVAFPWPMHAAVWLIGALPADWTDPLFRRLPKKPSNS